jgi:hypothetical protein
MIQRLIAMRRESKGRGGRRLHDSFSGAILLSGGASLGGQNGETAYFFVLREKISRLNETNLDSLALWAFQFCDA